MPRGDLSTQGGRIITANVLSRMQFFSKITDYSKLQTKLTSSFANATVILPNQDCAQKVASPRTESRRDPSKWGERTRTSKSYQALTKRDAGTGAQVSSLASIVRLIGKRDACAPVTCSSQAITVSAASTSPYSAAGCKSDCKAQS